MSIYIYVYIYIYIDIDIDISMIATHNNRDPRGSNSIDQTRIIQCIHTFPQTSNNEWASLHAVCACAIKTQGPMPG